MFIKLLFNIVASKLTLHKTRLGIKLLQQLHTYLTIASGHTPFAESQRTTVIGWFDFTK